jgi:enterochelin esterase-like enzyme
MTARRVVALALTAWAVAGVAGVASYARHYDLYRGFPPPKHPRGIAAGKLLDVRFRSPRFGKTRSYLIALPPGYEAAAARGERFPVLYVLHGTSGSPRLMTRAGAAQVRFDTLLAQHRMRPFLSVMPDGRDGTRRSDTEWADTPHGNYEGLVLDTVRAVDRRWATIPDRRARAIAGLSEGGYGAVNIALRNVRTFSIAQSWSGYFTQTHFAVFKHLPDAMLDANSPDLYVRRMGPALRRYPFRALLYTGGPKDPARRNLPRFVRHLRDAGGSVRVVYYPGGHDWRLWRTHMPDMLRYASQDLWRRG